MQTDAGVGLVRTLVPSPVGELTIVAGPAGLRALLWPGELTEGDRAFIGAIPADVPELPLEDARGDARLGPAIEQLDEYFAGTRREFDLPLDPIGTPFQLRAWELLRTIPYGRTVTYGEQARRLGDVNMTRAVGAANGRNPISIVVPCHRVIGAGGKLVGFGGGLPAKKWLLDHESDTLF